MLLQHSVLKRHILVELLPLLHDQDPRPKHVLHQVQLDDWLVNLAVVLERQVLVPDFIYLGNKLPVRL